MTEQRKRHPVVLIIEDDPGHQRLLEICVKRAGCDCDCASDGRSGLQKAFKNPYDLILVDIHIPEMDGFIIATELRENKITTPLVAITALKFEGLEKKALAVGYNCFFQKPIKPETIKEIVHQYLFKKSPPEKKTT